VGDACDSFDSPGGPSGPLPIVVAALAFDGAVVCGTTAHAARAIALANITTSAIAAVRFTFLLAIGSPADLDGKTWRKVAKLGGAPNPLKA
jgi:hypothetical protein